MDKIVVVTKKEWVLLHEEHAQLKQDFADLHRMLAIACEKRGKPPVMLEAENEKLKKALERIAALCEGCDKNNVDDCVNYCRDISAVTIAEEALARQKKQWRKTAKMKVKKH